MDITKILDEGLSFGISVISIYALFWFGRLVSKYIPRLMAMFKDFILVWDDFSDSMLKNSESVEKNTKITDLSSQHSVRLLSEFATLSELLIAHDANALNIKSQIEEVKALINDNAKEEEILDLLHTILEEIREVNKDDVYDE